MRILRFPSPRLSDDSADCVSEGAQVEILSVRVSCGRAFAQHNQQDGRKDKDDSDKEPESERFIKHHHANGHCSQGLQSPHNRRRRGSHLMNGNGHQHQRKNRWYQTQPTGKEPCSRRRRQHQAQVGRGERLGQQTQHADQQHIESEFQRRHADARLIDHHDIDSISQRGHHDQKHTCSAE